MGLTLKCAALGRLAVVMAGVLGLFVTPEGVFACSVCYGDPESNMARGAVAGVWVLVGVVTFVMGGVAGTSLFWIHRSRRSAREPEAPASVVQTEKHAGL